MSVSHIPGTSIVSTDRDGDSCDEVSVSRHLHELFADDNDLKRNFQMDVKNEDTLHLVQNETERNIEIKQNSFNDSDSKTVELVKNFRELTKTDIGEWESKSELVRDSQLDQVVMKFIQARKFDVQKAVEMWRKTIEWRNAFDVDTILNKPNQNALQVNKALNNHFDHKFDRSGRPIYIEMVGKLEPKIFENLNMDQVMAYQRHNTEYRRKVLFPMGSMLAGKPVNQITAIIDLKGAGFRLLRKSVFQFLKQMSHQSQSYYPEFLARLFIVNAPTCFELAWRILKPWLDEGTRAKISIHRDLPKALIHQFIDPSALPSQYGGTCNCSGGCFTSGCLMQRMYSDVMRLGLDKCLEVDELYRDMQKLLSMQNVPDIYLVFLSTLHEKYSNFFAIQNMTL